MTLFAIPDMSCGHCKATIETALHAVDPTAAISVDLSARTARIDTMRTTEEIVRALDDAGYAVTPVA